MRDCMLFVGVLFVGVLWGSSSAGVQKSSAGVEILHMLSGCVCTPTEVLSIYALPLIRSKYILNIW